MQKNTVMKYLNVDCTSVICSFLDINKDTYVLDSFSLHEKEIEYWRESGDYEKCIKLQKKLSTLYLNKKNGK